MLKVYGDGALSHVNALWQLRTYVHTSLSTLALQ